MNKKIKIVTILMGILFIIIGLTVTQVTQANDNKQEYNLKVIYEGYLVLNENIEENKEVLIRSSKDNTITSFEMKEDKHIQLDKIDIPDDKVISYWNISDEDNKKTIEPVLIEKKDHNITFLADAGTTLSVDGKHSTPTITKSVDLGTTLSEIIPKVEKKDDYNFMGWYTIEEKKEEKKKKKKRKKVIQEYEKLDTEKEKVRKDMHVYALSYPDINNNKKDDRKEKVKLKIHFNINDEVVEKKVHVGQPIKLDTPLNDEYIFLGWYLDPEFKEEYNSEYITTDTSIYAKFKKPKEYVKNRELIKEKKVSDRVEDYIEEKNNEIYKKNKKRDEQEAKKRENKKENKSFGLDNKRYIFKNYNKEQTYFVKFLNDEEFLFSVALPYGNTIELLNENGQKVKEYSVRQNVSINLNELINVSEIPNFEAKTINRNNANILQIYPKKNKELNN